MPKLLTQEPTPGPAFEIAFPPFGIMSINIGFVIDELPWSAILRCERRPVLVLRDALL
jgi:hypothetical protein